ncbi:uncharacterized protein B0H18DRAFT_1116990 [Fomitopsis serialis]|uniref:uncharacterized protein n=1 Tax=Fomitopsis serialis TaxID=139415 RepID=UPI002007ECE0|nr:uncharacterized protein B0H18DRAFT_1116990 [Neoantrodia serialis]KAH9930304.1 hypothetical protein B0H18DRAFT_1116990 [Neoantrodia serialis]
MSYSDYGASISDYDTTESRPDKALVVECKYDEAVRKIRFSSTRTCSYELLRQRVEQGFSLFTTPFAITYTDDDGEVTDICTEPDLTEAIRYFSPVHEERPISSSSSIMSGRSLTRGKITLRVRITVEYDGPSLSDTSSLVSLEEYNNRNGSELSLSPSQAPRGEVDDDSVTVSSKDMGSKYDVYRTQGTKTVVMAASREPLISKSPQPSTHASQWENGSSTSLHPSLTSEILQSASNSQDVRMLEPDPFADGHSHVDSSDVFERLKLEDGHHPGSSHGSSTLHSERGAAWLRDQNARTIKSMLGDMPSPSEDSFGVHASDAADRRSVLSGELALHQDSSGKYYYAYTVGSSYAASHDSDEDASDLNRSSVQVEPALSRPTSMEIHGADMHDESRPSGSDLKRSVSNTATSSSASNPFADPGASAEVVYPADFIHPDVPPEVLQFITTIPPTPPRDPPTCSNCTIILDAIRYVCSTCGEKRPMSPSASSDSSGKGKDRAIDYDARSANGLHAYPPSPRSNSYPSSSPTVSSSSNSSWSVVSGSEYSHVPMRSFSDSTINTHASSNGKRRPPKPLPAIPTSSTANSSSTLVPRMMVNGNGHGPYPSRNSGVIGYELCWECLPGAGVTHALEMSVAPGSSPVLGNWSTSGEDALSQWRRTAPSQKGQLRHAYVEKSWGHRGWQDVEQDDRDSCNCSTCGTAIVNSRFKCASCEDFNLCKACYSQVHEIHPSHAFLIVPDKIGRPRAGSGSTGMPFMRPMSNDGEYSLKHPGVKCMYCMQDIIGARFHCAICDAVDICQNCEAAGLPGNLDSTETGHSSSHIMIKIPYPLPNAELQTASERAKSLWSGRDAATGQIVRSRRNSLLSTYDRTVLGVGSRSGPSSADGTTSNASSEDHGVRCDACNERIIGVRYQCASCSSLPKAYSLCAKCEERSYVVHDSMHVFFKLHRPLDRPLQIEYPLVPRVYKYPVGPTDGRFDPGNPKAYLNNLLHPTALCDRCMTRPAGVWFRCAYCAMDLCETCQEMDTHNDNHVFIMFKSLIDISLLKRFSDLNNPQPIIPYPIYNIL